MYLFQPFIDGVQCFLIAEIVNKYYSNSIFIVGSCDSSEGLLSGLSYDMLYSIPYLYFDGLAIDVYFFGRELYTHSRVAIRNETVVDESV